MKNQNTKPQEKDSKNIYDDDNIPEVDLPRSSNKENKNSDKNSHSHRSNG